jgi:hypothetical protein
MSGDKPSPAEATDRGVIELIAQIKSGEISGRNLAPEVRRDCVEYLNAEGLSRPEIAKVLGRNERTIVRDLEQVRKANALTRDDALADRFAGQLVAEAANCVTRIRRVTREKDAPHAVRVDGERAVFQITDSLVARLQSLGHLPSAAQRVQADLTHNFGEAPSFSDFESEITRLAGITGSIPGSDVTDLARLGAVVSAAKSIGDPAVLSNDTEVTDDNPAQSDRDDPS